MDPELSLAVSDTNEEALASKISAIRKGYFSDPYAQQFASFKGNRDIIMHRGYWARVHLVRNLTKNMLDSCDQQSIQIISLGCGLETLWFNLMDCEAYQNKNLKFVELDLATVVKKKIKKIEKSKLITNLVTKLGLYEHRQISENYSKLAFGDKYLLHACDLSNLKQFQEALVELNVDYSRPTFFYCECVLSYIEPNPVDDLLKFIHDSFRLSWIFDYEMFNPNDRFGKMMVKNFDDRGCTLAGVHAYPNLEDQTTRFEKAGYENIQLDSMDKIYYHYIDKNERMKIEKLEMLDELEEWNIMMGHYFALLASSYHSQVNIQVEQLMLSKMKMNEQ